MIAGNEIIEAADVLGESRAIAPELHDNLRQSRMLRRQLREAVKRFRKTSAKSQKILAEAPHAPKFAKNVHADGR